MVATTTRPAERQRLVRFDVAERVLHWVNASLFLTVMATAAVLYVGPLSAAVGRRELVRHIHVWCGIALPVPVLVTLLSGRWGRAFRADVSRLNRWTADDKRWFRSLGRDPYVQLGKFNPGQKLNATFIAGVIVVMLATGSIMNWFRYFPVDWRTGATFVHDWIAVILFVVVVGHIGMALADPESLGSMVRGWIDARWARERRPRWYAEELPFSKAVASGGAGAPAREASPADEGRRRLH
ncbi:MAG: cytochrome b/b6 domain-containing protein [Acidimicrobiia bacterium]|nr:cytochrome b/b6 domain-containing protein [Acidimicrobiia bacterium]